MSPGADHEDAQTGTRLAKCVMALANCSRRAAEALIVAGGVLVDEKVVREPARRVPTTASLRLAGDAQATLRGLQSPLTLLWHQDRTTAPSNVLPAFAPMADGVAAEAGQSGQMASQLLGLAPGASPPTPARLSRLQALLALQPGQSGLAVWSDDPAVQRRLLDRQRPLEQEWRVFTPAPWPASHIETLAHAGWRASLTQQTPGRCSYRLVGRQPGGPPPALIGREGVCGPLQRLRIGALGLSPLTAGQARLLRPGERF